MRTVGAGILLLLLPPLAWTAGCHAEDVPPSDPELRDELGIPDHVPIHRVNVGGRGAADRLVPDRVEAAPGDLVQFLVTDRRVHVIRFLVDELDPEQRSFLAETDQLESPPLVHRESRFIVSFQGAPPGRYPFESGGHGEPARGVVTVHGPP